MSKNYIKDSLPITAEYCSSITGEEISKACTYKLPIKDVINLGGTFMVTAAAISEAAINTANNEGLYRCIFPEGITGHLAAFKDGSGLIGTIINENGIAGNARWIPAEETSILLAINPVTLAIAAAMLNINRKLDAIQETQKGIIKLITQDKESQLEGAVNSLADIHEKYRYNNDNEKWKVSHLTIVSSIKAKAEHNIIFFRKQILNALDKQRFFHGNKGIDKLNAELHHGFKYYQTGLHLFSYASFLEVVLSENYSEEFLNHVSKKIREYANQYRIDYTKCYDLMESYSKNSVQKKLLGTIGTISNAAGIAVARIPGISKGPMDEALITTGERIRQLNKKHTKETMGVFRDNRETDVQLFLDNIETINKICNNPVEILFDNKIIYLRS